MCSCSCFLNVFAATPGRDSAYESGGDARRPLRGVNFGF